jgi:hypothetical protein
MEFQHLLAATKLVGADTLYFNHTEEWSAKRDALLIQLHDLPVLESLYLAAPKTPYREGSPIVIVDQVPRIRLMSACEATANCLYSMAELAAFFGNKASGGRLPSKFNRLREKAAGGLLPGDLVAALGDLQWYERVRELRTEWTHYSTMFIGEEGGAPLLIARSHRRPSDRKQFPAADGVRFRVCNLVDWTKHAIETVDRFAVYLLTTYVLPQFDPTKEILAPVFDGNGMISFERSGLIATERITTREYLRRRGMSV